VILCPHTPRVRHYPVSPQLLFPSGTTPSWGGVWGHPALPGIHPAEQGRLAEGVS